MSVATDRLKEKEKKMNQELLNKLVKAYENKVFAIYSDWAGAQALENSRFATLLDSQDVFSEEDIANVFFERFQPLGVSS